LTAKFSQDKNSPLDSIVKELFYLTPSLKTQGGFFSLSLCSGRARKAAAASADRSLRSDGNESIAAPADDIWWS